VRTGWMELTISPGHCIWRRYQGSINRGVAVNKEECTVFRAVGISWPPPRWIALSAKVTSRILTLVDRTGSSQSGPLRYCGWAQTTRWETEDELEDKHNTKILLPCRPLKSLNDTWFAWKQ
jgi:hypothetical protein